MLRRLVNELERDAALQADAVTGQVVVGELEMEVQRREAVALQRRDQVAGLLPVSGEDDMVNGEDHHAPPGRLDTTAVSHLAITTSTRRCVHHLRQAATDPLRVGEDRAARQICQPDA